MNQVRQILEDTRRHEETRQTPYKEEWDDRPEIEVPWRLRPFRRRVEPRNSARLVANAQFNGHGRADPFPGHAHSFGFDGETLFQRRLQPPAIS